MWNQVYHPFGSAALSTIAAALNNGYGHEGTILRYVFKHSIACLVGLLVMLPAYVHPFTAIVLK